MMTQKVLLMIAVFGLSFGAATLTAMADESQRGDTETPSDGDGNPPLEISPENPHDAEKGSIITRPALIPGDDAGYVETQRVGPSPKL